MSKTTKLQCRCGLTSIEVSDAPIMSVECCCSSCQEASEKIQGLEGAPQILTAYGATPFVMYRKDRVSFLTGENNLKAFRLSSVSTTKRIIASCCNTPVFLKFKGGHWLSLYTEIWPAAALPPAQMRTMVSDLPMGTRLPDNIPNAKKHSFEFFIKLFSAWVAMGFRNPKILKIEVFEV